MLLPAANKSAQTVSVSDSAGKSSCPAADASSAAGLFEPTATDITGIRIHANDDCEFDFSVRGELTVTVYTDTQDFSASFYQEQGDDKYAYVVAGADNERFLKTDAWRVGTLLLTCEGTRIFDASGQETPVE